MWPLILASSMFFSMTAMAGPGRDAWNSTDIKGKEQLLEAYRGWFNTASSIEKTSEWQTKKTTYFSLFSEAWATEGMDCIYAGWPSKRQGTCNSPARNNPDYQSGNCSSNELHCQPLFFGEGLCVPVNTRQQRSTAYTQCEKNFERSGRTLSSVVEGIRENGSEAQLLSLLDFADGICANSAQARTGMCRRLESKVASIRDELENAVATIAEVSRTVASAGFGPIVCTNAEVPVTQSTTLTTVPLSIDNELPIVTVQAPLIDIELAQVQPVSIEPVARRNLTRVPLSIDTELTPLVDTQPSLLEVEVPQISILAEEDEVLTEAETVDEVPQQLDVVIPEPAAVITTSPTSFLLNPSDFVEAALSGPLEFVGSGTISRPTRVQSCVFKNGQVFVVYMPCDGDGSQVGMKIISPNGGTVDLALQNNGESPSAGLQRSSYNNVWQVGYSRSPPVSIDSDFNRIAQNVSSGSFADYCSVGPTVSNPNPRCSGNMPGLEQSWLPVAREFWDNPGSGWSSLLNQTENNISQAR